MGWAAARHWNCDTAVAWSDAPIAWRNTLQCATSREQSAGNCPCAGVVVVCSESILAVKLSD